MNTPLTVSVHMTYRDHGAYMREVSWRDRSGEFCWKVTCGARNVRQVLVQLAHEFGSITVARHPQESVWK